MKILFNHYKFTVFIFLLSILNTAPIHGIEENEEVSDLSEQRKIFATGNIETKIEILRKIAKTEDKMFLPLFYDAVEYLQNSYSILNNNNSLLEIGKLTVTNLGNLNEKKAAPKIRYLFSTIDDEDFQIICLTCLSKLMEHDANFIQYLNSLYQDGFSDLISGRKMNTNLLIAYADALGKFADSSSFEILFTTLLYPVSDNLKTSVKNALGNISFDYFYEIVEKTAEKNIQYIWTLYSLASDNKKISNTQLGEITEKVISYAIDFLESDTENAEKLIIKTLPVLSDLKWSKAADCINQFFYFEQTKWKKEKKSDTLIKVINCMGNLGSTESSRNLLLFLGALNSETEKTKQYDEPLVIAAIEALGRLGDKTAFDYLLYIEYLDYSEPVKQAAKHAIEELSW